MIRLLRTSFQPVIVMVVLVAAIAAAPMSSAQTPATPEAVTKSFEFYPQETGLGTYFNPTLKAGQTEKFKVIIANTGSVAQNLATYPTNAYTRDGGGFASAAMNTPPNEVTTWLNYPADIYSIEPGKGLELTFEISVPDDTPPGQYITAIATQQIDPSAVGGYQDLKQLLRYVIPVFITVPGETSKGFGITNIDLVQNPDNLVVGLAIENTGDVRVRPEGSIQLLDQSGALIATFPVKMDSVYAHDSTTLTLGASGSLPPGTYTVRVNLSDAETGTTATAEKSGLEAAAAATPVPQQVVSPAATAAPKPAADNVQFAEVAATIVNHGEQITNAQLSLVASKDGAEVERFPISQSLSLPTGETPVTTRYIPAEGWSSGSWTFELLVETVDPSGAAVVIARLPVDGTITIP